MTVKDLKEILNNAPNDYEVIVEWALVGDTSNCKSVTKAEVDNYCEFFVVSIVKEK